ncbi:MAG: M28 family peptidase [Bacilli bacterium]
MRHRFIVVLLVLLFSLILSFFVLYTPQPIAGGDVQEFSAVNVAQTIEVISREPHSVFDEEAHEEVRKYLKQELEALLGLANVYEMNYTAEAVNEDYPVKNLIGSIPGESETGLLLVGHYDSRGHIGRYGELGRSYGAADDGYAIGTMLEIARLYAGKNLKTSLYFLLTDAEEVGLLGAKQAVLDANLMDKISFVINVEARGIKGPSYMFETSPNNEKVIDFYKHADLPVSYSLATAVYSVMPNYTDFTEFLKIGKTGINFAVLDNLYYYHTPLDNYTNINLSSIQHYGSQIVPLIDEFTSNDKYQDLNYFVGEQDQIFFTLLPNVLVTYKENFAVVLHIILLVIFIGLFIYLILKKKITILSFIKYLGIDVGLLAVLGFIGFVISKIMAFFGKVPWSLTYVRMDNTELPTLIIILVIVVGLGFIYYSTIKKEETKWSFGLAGVFLNLLLALLTGFVLSGASFLFFIPAFWGTISLLSETFMKNKIIRCLILSQNIIWNVLLLVPILYSLFLALTVGGLLALLVILGINLTITIPMFRRQLTI